MRFSTVVAAASLVASASASALYSRQIPSCANPCLAPIAQQYSKCSVTDNACLCKDDTFVKESTQCIVNNCQGDELTTAVAASQSICKAFGVTLTGTLPTPQSTTDTAAATDSGAPTTSAPTTSGTATAPAGSSTGSSSTSSAPAAATSNSAMSNTVSGAFAGLVAVGVAALAL